VVCVEGLLLLPTRAVAAQLACIHSAPLLPPAPRPQVGAVSLSCGVHTHKARTARPPGRCITFVTQRVHTHQAHEADTSRALPGAGQASLECRLHTHIWHPSRVLSPKV
jgi:hypothetical protein